MAKDKEIIDVEDIDMIEEAYDRVDLLVSILEKKGILGKGEYDTKLEAFLDKKYDENKE